MINRYLLRQEGRNTATGENFKLVETVGFVLMVVISFVAMAVHDLAKQVAK